MKNPEWGLFPENLEENPPDMYWGACAIITRGILDIPYDRQSFQTAEGFADDNAKQAFIEWINEDAVPMMEYRTRKLATSHIEGHNKENTFHFVAEDRNSGGYLYIGAYAYVGDIK